MTNKPSFFSTLTNSENNTLSNLVFVAQYISGNELNTNNFKNHIHSIRTKSDKLLASYSALQFLEPLNNFNSSNTLVINANALNLSNVKFDGNTLSFNLSDGKKFLKSLSFTASNLVLTTSSYSLDENTQQFEIEFSDPEENEHINDIINEYPNILDIYFNEDNGVVTMHIFFLNDNIEPDMTGFAEIIEMKFDFTNVV